MMTTVFAVLLLLVSIVTYALLTAQDGGDDE